MKRKEGRTHHTTLRIGVLGLLQGPETMEGREGIPGKLDFREGIPDKRTTVNYGKHKEIVTA